MTACSFAVVSLWRGMSSTHTKKETTAYQEKPALSYLLHKTWWCGINFSVHQEVSANKVACVHSGLLWSHKKIKCSRFQHHGWDWKTLLNEIGSRAVSRTSAMESWSCWGQNSEWILEARENRGWGIQWTGQWAQWEEERVHSGVL